MQEVESIMPPGFYNMDCMDAMKQFPDKFFGLGIVDPPYGIGADQMCMGKGKNKKWERGNIWDSEPPPDEYFTQLFRICKHSIIWGGNYYDLPKTGAWIVWDKGRYGKLSFADCEFAWTDFPITAKIARIEYDGFRGADEGGRIHSVQKPVALYSWLLGRFAKPGDKILDTHVGSASSLIAFHRAGLEYWGYEIDPVYYATAKERLENEKAQMNFNDIL